MSIKGMKKLAAWAGKTISLPRKIFFSGQGAKKEPLR
jgi:hypothetical protein